ncbi:MAG: electron transport complex subunit RsxA [Lachnospiraceae bacterium]|nr:electron transport complex subunit RsxA [Lachnospiraceae bacterium]
MMNIILLAISAAFVNNVILSQFMGICPFLGVSKKVSTAAGMGGAVIFVMAIASTVTSLIYKFVLEPLDLKYMNTIVFILVIASLVQFVEMFLKKAMPSLYQALGVYLPLITTNCAVLGIALKNVESGYTIFESIINGIFSAVGFAVAIVIMAGIREKIDKNDVPMSFRGAPIVLITAGLMAIAFMGLNGLIK